MKTKILFTSIFVFCYSFAFAQFDLSLGPDWNFTGVGARAAGMGGAFIGVADDATAISWNPAGLTQLDKPEASIVGRGLAEAYQVDFDYAVENYEDQHGILNFLSGVYPFKFVEKQFVAAVAVQRQLDLYSYYHEEYLEENGSESQELFYETFSEGGASTITLGLANRVASIFSLGVAANLWVGEAYQETNDEMNIDSGSSYYDYTYYDNSDWIFSGFNVTIGSMLDFNYLSNPLPLKLGIVVKTPFSLNVEETFTLEEYADSNGVITEYLPDDETESYSLDMPLMFGLGASYRLGDNLTLAIDIESRKFGETTLKEDYEYLTGNDEEMENLDMNQLRFGAEYLFTEFWDFAVIPLRIGGRSVPTLFNDIDEEQVIGGAFSIGTGIITDQYSIDITAENSAFEIDRMLDDTDGFVYKKTVSTVTLSCIYYF